MGSGEGLASSRRIAADHAVSARRQLQQFNQRIGKAHALVGDNAPAEIQGFQRVEQLGNAVEQAGCRAQPLFVNFQKAMGKTLVVWIGGVNVEPGLEQPAYPLRGVGAQHGKRLGGVAFFGEQQIGRLAQIGRRVGQCAVEVEENGLKHAGWRTSCS